MDFRLDTMVSVVNCERVLTHLAGGASETKLSPSIVHCLARQVEFADMIVVEGCELRSREDVSLVKRCLGMLNPEAGLLCMGSSKVPSYEVLGRGEYMLRTLKVRQPTAKWFDQRGSRISSIAAFSGCTASCCRLPPALQQATCSEDVATLQRFHLHMPFSPQRLGAVLIGSVQIPGRVARITGTFWLASRPEHRFAWSTVGSSTEFAGLGPWTVGE